MSGHRARLDVLREHEADLTYRLGTRAHTSPDRADLSGLADQLGEIIAYEGSEQAKELFHLLGKEIRVHHHRRRIIPTYRIPAAVRAIPVKVDPLGIEPNPFARAALAHALSATTADGAGYGSGAAEPGPVDQADA